MSFEQSIKTHLPGTMTATDFIEAGVVALGRLGFENENTIACVGVCRDEITQPLCDLIKTAWGEAFNFCSLGGMLLLGRTGFHAAHHHAPMYEGRERYAHFNMPHIAIDADGTFGVCHRRNQPHPSTACGALVVFQNELASGHLNMTLDPDDLEQSLLKQRLLQHMHYGEVPDLLGLTRIACEVILEDLERMLSLTVDLKRADYAVLNGIQIHGPDEIDYIWPKTIYALVKGERQSVQL